MLWVTFLQSIRCLVDLSGEPVPRPPDAEAGQEQRKPDEYPRLVPLERPVPARWLIGEQFVNVKLVGTFLHRLLKLSGVAGCVPGSRQMSGVRATADSGERERAVGGHVETEVAVRPDADVDHMVPARRRYV